MPLSFRSLWTRLTRKQTVRVAPRAQLTVEGLENRALPSAVTQAFVNQTFQSLLGHGPEPAALTALTNALDLGLLKPAQVVQLVTNIRQGQFPLKPRSEHCTETCPFGQVCRITQARAVAKEGMLPLPREDGKKGGP